MNVDPDGKWAVDVFWLLVDTASFIANPTPSGAAWLAQQRGLFCGSNRSLFLRWLMLEKLQKLQKGLITL